MGLFSNSKPDPVERDENGDRKYGWQGPSGPENTPDEKRFYRNRESGYSGWIDQDGYRCNKNGVRTGGDS